MFQVNTPIHRAEDVERLIEAGADSFYAGVMSASDNARNTCLSHRQGPWSNFRSTEELGRAVARAHAHHVPLYLTLNARLLIQEDESRFIEMLRHAKDVGVDGVVVSNPYGLMLTRQMLPDIHIAASVNFGILNSAAVRAIAALGVKRVIVARHLLPCEIAAIADSCPDVEIEAFVANIMCAYHDAFCGFHYDRIEGETWPLQGCGAVADPRIPRMRPTACGACALPAFADKVAAVKVVGRDFSTDSIERTVRFIASLKPLLTSRIDSAEFRAKAKLAYRAIFGTSCGNDCYYEMGF